MSKHFLYPDWLRCQNQQGGVQTWVHPVAPPRSRLSQPRGLAGRYCHSFPTAMLELPPHGHSARGEHIGFAQKQGVAWRQPQTGPWLTTWQAGGSVVLTCFKKSHRSHLANQEELQIPLAGYRYFHNCPKSTDGVKARQSSRSFSSCQRLLAFWGRTMLKNPCGSTDEDRARAWWSPMGLAACFAFSSSTSNPKEGMKHLWAKEADKKGRAETMRI